VPWDDAIVASAGKLRKLWDSLSELRSSLCERRLERTVLRPALLPVKTSQFTQFFPSGMSHSKIAQFNWEGIGRLILPASAGGKHADPCHQHESTCCMMQFFKQISITYFLGVSLMTNFSWEEKGYVKADADWPHAPSLQIFTLFSTKHLRSACGI
jgi:hypothetical protein